PAARGTLTPVARSPGGASGRPSSGSLRARPQSPASSSSASRAGPTPAVPAPPAPHPPSAPPSLPLSLPSLSIMPFAHAPDDIPNNQASAGGAEQGMRDARYARGDASYELLDAR